MKRLLFILNPAAGTKKAAKRLSDILAVFSAAGFRTEVFLTAKSGDAADFAARFGGEVDLVVASGGDGTLNETVSGLIAAGHDVPVGYIPAGSTNDFASSLGLSTNVTKAAAQIVNGTESAFDVGRFGDRYFTYVASFGAFTRTSFQTPQNVKNALGHLAYILEGMGEISSIRKESVRMVLDGEVLFDEYLFGAVCNSVSVGGILTLKSDQVDMADGKFEILLIRAPRSLAELNECIVAVREQRYDCGMITFRSGTSVSVQASPDMVWSLDGERAQGLAQVQIEILPRRLRLIH